MRRCVYELQVKRKPVRGLKIVDASNPEKVVEVLYSLDLAEAMQEKFYVLHLSTKNQVIGYEEISRGLIDRAHVAPREVFRGAIVNNSARIIIAHSHPSGHLQPSSQDKSITKDLIAAGKLLGISVVDHLIVAYNAQDHRRVYLSFREEDLMG